MGTLTSERSSELQSIVWDSSSLEVAVMIEAELTKVIDDGRGTIRDIGLHILNAGGKRVRPLLVWYSGLMFGAPSEALKRTAVAVELIHMASLIHDDVIDGSELRRNRPTAQKNWGCHRAVLGGDFFFAKAFGVLAETGLVKTLEIMAQAVQEMCRGEILQAADQFNTGVSLERYYERITKKTAVLLEASCKAGALVAGAPEFEAETIGRFGLNLGLAFQITDDIMDLCGDEAKMGKAKYADLIKGNITLPLVLLLKEEGYRDWINTVIKEREFNRAQLERIESTLRESGAIERAFAIGAAHLEEARKILSGFADSSQRRFLSDLTYMLQARAN